MSSFNNKMFESMATLNKDCEKPFEQNPEDPEDSQSLGRASAFDVARPSQERPTLVFEDTSPKPNNMINLENILLLEGKIQQIYENTSLNFSKVTSLCEDWWEITQEEITLQELGILF